MKYTESTIYFIFLMKPCPIPWIFVVRMQRFENFLMKLRQQNCLMQSSLIVMQSEQLESLPHLVHTSLNKLFQSIFISTFQPYKLNYFAVLRIRFVLTTIIKCRKVIGSIIIIKGISCICCVFCDLYCACNQLGW